MKKFKVRIQEVIDTKYGEEYIKFNQRAFAKKAKTTDARIHQFRTETTTSITAEVLFRMAEQLGLANPFDLLEIVDVEEEGEPAGA